MLQVEGKQGNFGCYYFYENLKEDVEDPSSDLENENPDAVYDTPHALPGGLDHGCGEWSFPQILDCAIDFSHVSNQMYSLSSLC